MICGRLHSVDLSRWFHGWSECVVWLWGVKISNAVWKWACITKMQRQSHWTVNWEKENPGIKEIPFRIVTCISHDNTSQYSSFSWMLCVSHVCPFLSSGPLRKLGCKLGWFTAPHSLWSWQLLISFVLSQLCHFEECQF